jgi:hypothetical protein
VWRWEGGKTWDEFPATAHSYSILDGRGNVDEMAVPSRGCTGMTLRLYNPIDSQWSL